MDLTEKARLLKNKIDTLASQSGGTVEGLDDFIKGCPYLQGFASGSPITLNDVALIDQELDITVRSKNRLMYPYYNVSGTSNGITVEVNGNGSLTCNGTATDAVKFFLMRGIDTLPENIIQSNKDTLRYIPYTASLSHQGEYTGTVNLYLNYYRNGITASSKYTGWMTVASGASKTAFAPTDMQGVYFYLSIAKNAVLNNVTFYPQLEIGESKTEWGIPSMSMEGMPPIQVNATDSNGNVQSASVALNTGKAECIYNSTKTMTLSVAWASGGSEELNRYVVDATYYRA